MKLNLITLNIKIRLYAELLFVFDWDVTVLDETVTLYRRNRRSLRDTSQFDRLHSKSTPDELLQASIGILENIGAGTERELRESLEVKLPPARYANVSNRQMPRRARLGVTSRRHRRSDGASHFQDGAVIVEDVAPASTPTLVINEAGQMACAWSYINPNAVPPFGHGVALTRFDDGQWEGTLQGFNLLDDTVASNPVVLAVPGENLLIVVFNRIVLPKETLLEASMANAAGGELLYATMPFVTSSPPVQAKEPVQLTNNHVMDGSASLHTEHGEIVLTYFRQNSANIEDPSFTLITRRWDAASQTFGEENTVASGNYAGPARHSQTTQGGEVVVFSQQNANRDGYVIVYSWRSAPSAEWSVPARIDRATQSFVQKDPQLLGGRRDNNFLIAWLADNVAYYRMVALPMDESDEEQTPIAALSIVAMTHTTEQLLSVRAADHEMSYLVTLDTELASAEAGQQNKSLHSANRVLHFHALPDSAQVFGDNPVPMAQSSVLEKKETGHVLAYDPKHHRIVVATQEELVDALDIRRTVQNLRTDTVDILPDLAVEDLHMNSENQIVTFQITNHGLLPAAVSEVQVFLGTITQEVATLIKTEVVPELQPGETKIFQADVASGSLANSTLSRVWASSVTSFAETTTANNHRSTFPDFRVLELRKVNWRAADDGASITIEALLRSNATRGSNGNVGMAICTLQQTKDSDGVVYNESWHIIGRATVSVGGHTGHGSLSVPTESLLSSDVLVVLTHDLVDATTVTMDPSSASNIHTKRVKVPLKPNLYIHENSVVISESPPRAPGRQSQFSVAATVTNTGLSPVKNATVQVWLPDSRANGTMPLADQARTGLLLRQEQVNVNRGGSTSVEFETDGLKVGHSKIIVLVNEDRRLEESAYADNTMLKDVYIAAAAQVQIDASSVTLSNDNSAISVVVRNTGTGEHRMGSLFALVTDSDTLDSLDSQVLGEPSMALSISSGGAFEFTVDLHDVSMLTDCTHRNVLLAYIQADRVVDGGVPLSAAIATQADTPAGSAVFVPLQTLLDDGDACDRRRNKPPVANNQTLSVFQDKPMQIKCDGYDPEGDAFGCVVTAMDMQGGSLWHVVRNVSQQILPDDLPVRIVDLTMVYVPDPHTFWGGGAGSKVDYFLDALLLGTPNKRATASSQTSAGAVSIQNVPYSGSHFQTTDVRSCQRLCHFSTKCTGIEFKLFNSTQSLLTNCRMVRAQFDRSKGHNAETADGEEAVQCYSKRAGSSEQRLQTTAHGDGPQSDYGFDLVRNGRCQGAADTSGTSRGGDDGNEATVGVVIAVLVVFVVLFIGAFYMYRRRIEKSETYSLGGAAAVPGTEHGIVPNASFDALQLDDTQMAAGDANTVVVHQRSGTFSVALEDSVRGAGGRGRMKTAGRPTGTEMTQLDLSSDDVTRAGSNRKSNWAAHTLRVSTSQPSLSLSDYELAATGGPARDHASLSAGRQVPSNGKLAGVEDDRDGSAMADSNAALDAVHLAHAVANYDTAGTGASSGFEHTNADYDLAQVGLQGLGAGTLYDRALNTSAGGMSAYDAGGPVSSMPAYDLAETDLPGFGTGGMPAYDLANAGAPVLGTGTFHDQATDMPAYDLAQAGLPNLPAGSMPEYDIANAGTPVLGTGTLYDHASNGEANNSTPRAVVVPFVGVDFDDSAMVFDGISRVEATQLLKADDTHGDGTFLLRSKGDIHVLSMLSKGRTRHHKITRDADGAYKVNDAAPRTPCTTATALMQHWSVQPEGGTSQVLVLALVPGPAHQDNAPVLHDDSNADLTMGHIAERRSSFVSGRTHATTPHACARTCTHANTQPPTDTTPHLCNSITRPCSNHACGAACVAQRERQHTRVSGVQSRGLTPIPVALDST